MLSLGACFEFYDLFFSAYIAPALYAQRHLHADHQGLPGHAGFASFVAPFLPDFSLARSASARFADRFGRRSIFSFSLLWYSACTFIDGLSVHRRCHQPLALPRRYRLGVEMITIGAYVSELAPRNSPRRSLRLQSICQLPRRTPRRASSPASLVPPPPRGSRRLALGRPHRRLGAIFVWFIRREPFPNPQDGLSSTAAPRKPTASCKPSKRASARRRAQPCPNRGPSTADLPQTRGSLSEIWGKRYRARTILLTVFHVLQPIGYYGFAGWVPTLLLAEGITVTQSLRYTFIIALASPLGPLLGWRFADVFERKWQVAGAALAIAVFGLLFAFQRTALGVVLFGVLITLSSNWMSFAYHTYQSELYPTRIRARAVGFVYSWSRLSTVFSSFVIALFLRNYGTVGVFIFIACSMLMVCLLVGGFGPRTARRPLEEIAR